MEGTYCTTWCQTEVIATACFNVRNPPERLSSWHCRHSGSLHCNRLNIIVQIPAFGRFCYMTFHLKSIILKIQTCRFSTQRCDLGMGSTLFFGHLWSWDPNLPKTVDSKNLYSLTSPRGPGLWQNASWTDFTPETTNKQGTNLPKNWQTNLFRACPAGMHPTNWRPHT